MGADGSSGEPAGFLEFSVLAQVVPTSGPSSPRRSPGPDIQGTAPKTPRLGPKGRPSSTPKNSLATILHNLTFFEYSLGGSSSDSDSDSSKSKPSSSSSSSGSSSSSDSDLDPAGGRACAARSPSRPRSASPSPCPPPAKRGRLAGRQGRGGRGRRGRGRSG